MKNIILLQLVFCILFLQPDSFAQEIKMAEKKIDSIFSTYQSNTPGVAVAIVKDGKVIFKKGYGMADLNNNIPITPQTVFNIASVSKQFTAFAFYLLKYEGRLSLEDDIRKYLPELPDYGQPVKIKHLLAHTSGLRDQIALASIGGYEIITTGQALKLISRVKKLNFTPGTMFGYSNTGYTLLAEIIHRITGKSFAEFTRESIFQPLGMYQTEFSDNHEKVIKNKAASYEKSGNQFFKKADNSSNPGPSNLLTTAEDLCKWVLNFEKPVVGTPQLIEEFNQVSTFDNGHPVFLRVIDGDTIYHAKGQNKWRHKGLKIFSHGGHTAAFRTFLGRFPDQHLSIIQLSNDEYNERLGGRWDLADYFISDKYPDLPKTQSISPVSPGPAKTENYKTPLRDFIGEFYNDELETRYQFNLRDNQLVMSHIRLDDIVLKRTGESRFSGSGPGVFAFEINFRSDETGRILSFDISNFGVRNLQFEKTK